MLLTVRLRELMEAWDIEHESKIDVLLTEKNKEHELELARDDGTEVRRAAREGLASFIKDLEEMQGLVMILRAAV